MSYKMLFYKILCVLRVALVLIPQTGYIHPDEHFQGPEVAYGDTVGYSVLRTWEFSSSKPVRSIFFPYSVTIVPAILIRLVTYLQFTVSSYLLLILPRLLMCACSFLQDALMYKICVMKRVNFEPCLTLYASSYVTLVYFTRTFSNSFESMFFTIILFLLFKGISLQEKLAENLVLKQLTLSCFLSGVILVFGSFTRATFVCFSIYPVAMWCFVFYKKSIHTKVYLFVSFVLGVSSSLVALVALDTLYYNKMQYSSIKDFSIVCTPFNFIVYNLNIKNLSSHGLHSRWLHVFINVPLLFSVYGIIFILYSFVKLHHFCRSRLNFETVLILSFFTPLILLSLIPHQEPRFIIPLIIPLSLAYGSQQFRFYLSKKFLIYLWINSNMFCLLFYGFIHQSGVYLSASYLSSQVASNNAVVFYKTYMPPRYLLSLSEENKRVGVYDLGGVELSEFEPRVKDIINNKPSKVFIVLPYKILSSDIAFEALTMSGYKFMKIIDFFPHLSTENLPDIFSILKVLQKNSSFSDIVFEMQEFYSIHVIIFEKYFS